MSSSVLIRWGAIALMLGGVAWALLGLLALTGLLQAIPGREDVVLFVAATLLAAAGLIGLHTLQKGSYGLLGRAGLYIALAAMAAHLLAAVAFLAGNPGFQWLSSPVGSYGMLIGFVLYGVATLRAGVLPRWYGAALILAMPVSLPLAEYGTTLFGLVLLVLGYGLWSRKSAAAEQPSRVR